MSYLYVTSIQVECFDPDNEEASPLNLPRGAYIPIARKFVSRKTETGAPQTLYWLKFKGDDKLWLCAPQWFQAEEVESKPSLTVRTTDKHRAGAEYMLVKVEEDESEADVPANPLLQGGVASQHSSSRQRPADARRPEAYKRI